MACGGAVVSLSGENKPDGIKDSEAKPGEPCCEASYAASSL